MKEFFFEKVDFEKICRQQIKSCKITQYAKGKILCTQRGQSQGSYRQDYVKFKDFSRTSKGLSYCFQGLKTYGNKNTDLHIKILLLKC